MTTPVYGVILETENYIGTISFNDITIFSDVNEVKEYFLDHLELQLYHSEIDVNDEYDLNTYEVEYNEDENLPYIHFTNINDYISDGFALYVKKFIMK